MWCGCPSVVDVDKLKAIFEVDPIKTIQEIVNEEWTQCWPFQYCSTLKANWYGKETW